MVEIVLFEPKYSLVFGDLNKEWITKFFKMEANDYKSLDYPKEYIIDKGGFIFVGLLNQDPVGVCALIKVSDNEFELSKMAVSPKAQGLKIGQLLVEKAIEKSKELKLKRLFLDSNSSLKPALTLYEKVGFSYVNGFTSPYERADVQMELFF